MYNRGTMICLSVTGITTLLLFFYFRNKISQVEDKLDKVFDIIQDYSNNDRQSPEFVVREAPTPQNPQPVVMSTSGFERNNLIEVSEDEDDNRVNLDYNTNDKSSDDDNDDDSDSDSEDDDSDNDSEDEEPKKTLETAEESKEEVIVAKTLEVETDELTPKIEKDEKQPEDTEEDNDDDSDSDSEEETEEDSEEEDGGKNNLGNSDNDGEDVKKVSLEPTPDYSTMTVATLKDICSDKGLRGYKSLRKNDLVTLLEESHAN